jgi:hypothetical protein
MNGSRGEGPAAGGFNSSLELVAKPTQFREMVAATVFVGLWLAYLIVQGPVTALEGIWLLLLGVLVGAWCLLMRLRFGHGTLLFTVGLWHREVDLDALESIRRKSALVGVDKMLVKDRHGGRVPIYVGRFTGIEEWGPLLLDAAGRSNAQVDPQSRHLLEGAGAPQKRRRG